VGNVPSIRLLEKNKFIKEGIMRKHTKVGDNYEDSILYAKLINEHEAERSAVI
jgi:RimJ/RimL family protein N-acetyltransferase